MSTSLATGCSTNMIRQEQSLPPSDPMVINARADLERSKRKRKYLKAFLDTLHSCLIATDATTHDVPCMPDDIPRRTVPPHSGGDHTVTYTVGNNLHAHQDQNDGSEDLNMAVCPEEPDADQECDVVFLREVAPSKTTLCPTGEQSNVTLVDSPDSSCDVVFLGVLPSTTSSRGDDPAFDTGDSESASDSENDFCHMASTTSSRGDDPAFDAGDSETASDNENDFGPIPKRACLESSFSAHDGADESDTCRAEHEPVSPSCVQGQCSGYPMNESTYSQENEYAKQIWQDLGVDDNVHKDTNCNETPVPMNESTYSQENEYAKQMLQELGVDDNVHKDTHCNETPGERRVRNLIRTVVAKALRNCRKSAQQEVCHQLFEYHVAQNSRFKTCMTVLKKSTLEPSTISQLNEDQISANEFVHQVYTQGCDRAAKIREEATRVYVQDREC